MHGQMLVILSLKTQEIKLLLVDVSTLVEKGDLLSPLVRLTVASMNYDPQVLIYAQTIS